VRRAPLVVVLLGLAPAAAAQPPQGTLTSASSGAGLYAANCLRCHGANGEGVPAMGPALRGVGAGTVDFYLRTGYMPLASPDEQPSRHRVLFGERQLAALIRYVASFGSGPPIPTPRPDRGNVAQGLQLFTEHCAGCHQVVARGGVITGARVPSLVDATPVEIAEAVRAGPYVMPAFGDAVLSDSELNSIIRYVVYTRHPSQAGGWGIGFLGPVPEGMVAWLIAAVTLVAVCIVIGKRLEE
jgi:ubiquinol-cytochrome c reductase cytochrome c subunit